MTYEEIAERAAKSLNEMPIVNEIVGAEITGAAWLDVPVRIHKGDIYFGDHKLPGIIADGGVIFKPGGTKDINELTVTFLVGELTADDPLAEPEGSDQ